MTGHKTDDLPIQQWINNSEQWPLLENYMLAESRLPGPRVNLELAEQFAGNYAHSGVSDEAWRLISSWSAITLSEAGVNDPHEFLPFCGINASGRYYGHAGAGRRTEIESFLKSAMNDARWRIREAAAMAMQNIGEYNWGLLQALLDRWSGNATMLEQRAFVAALAHPPLLKNRENTLYCLKLAADIMKGIQSSIAGQADPEHFRVLSKGLEYSLSLFVASEPEAGFDLLRKCAESGDSRLVRIVRSNLGKTRLSKKYRAEVEDLLARLTMV